VVKALIYIVYLYIYIYIYIHIYIYYLPSCIIIPLGFLGIWANLAMYGRLLMNEATGQVGGCGFGLVLTKHILFGKDTP
jgi:hypothetical protein